MPISEQVLEDISNSIYKEEEFSPNEELNDEDAIKLAAALKKNSYIKRLNLHGQAIGDLGIQALAKVKYLKELKISNSTEGGNNCITAVGAKALARSRIKKLNITGNLIGDDGIIALANSYTIKQLLAAGCGITSKGAAEFFKINDSVKILDLSSNEIKNEGLSTIDLNKTIKDLNLFHCSITEKGPEFIAKNTSLKILILYGNKLGSSAKFLAEHPVLEHLVLDECKINDEVLEALANSKLRKLSVSDNKFTTNGVNSLVKNTSIEFLSICNTGLDDNSLKSLMGMKSLHTLDALSNNITEAGVSIVKEELARKEGHVMRMVDITNNKKLSQSSFRQKKRKAYELWEDELLEDKSKKHKIQSFL